MLRSLPVDVLHHQKVHAIRFVGVVCGGDVRVVEFGGCLDLPLEPLQRLRRFRGLGRQDLQCHLPLHPAVPGTEYLAHAAAAQIIQDYVVPHPQLGVFSAEQLPGLKLRKPL